MTFEQFKAGLGQAQPSNDLPPLLQALWYDANGNWEQAHTIAQTREGEKPYDRIHAYLHRKEGDRFNANYWYRRAGASFFDGTLDEEWAVLVKQLLG
ncbi:hypothetical protein G8759_30745 [Spirosoma aureum]|uniref:Uncharacterized protein n=1 Tax=Spirosoma aureum TaxID=2692134 RepID=A0A6G9AW55_9BACT|nr:hypothetical protein [Spirosoma aureum]QIP16711.1 hypothetical protein G8759_30745 [Spirosoma aureum]